jgi:hypothetical protein
MQQWMAEQMLAGAGVGYSKISFAILYYIQAHGRQHPHQVAAIESSTRPKEPATGIAG